MADPTASPQDAATAFAEDTGCRVLPVRGKVPLLTEWQHKASSDPGDIAQMPWDGADWFGVSLDGLSVVDIDDPLSDAGKRALGEAAGACGYWVTTPSGEGRRHLWFEGEADNWKDDTGGVQLKSGPGHQVVGPGAFGRVAHGHWSDLSLLPPLTAPVRRHRAPDGDDYQLLQPGHRNNGLAEVMGKVVELVGNLPDDKRRPLALALNEALCAEPLSDDEVLATVAQAKDWDWVRGWQPKADMIARFAPQADGVDLERATLLEVWKIRDQLPQPEPLLEVEGQLVLPARTDMVVFGRPAQGKSWLVAAALGTVAMAGGRAIYYDRDDSAQVAMERVITTLGLPPERAGEILYCSKDPTDADVEWLSQAEHPGLSQAEHPGLCLVVYDTAARWGGAQNDAAEFTRWHDKLITPWRKLGVATVVVTHTQKSPEAQATALGSVSATGAARYIVQVRSGRVTLAKDNHAVAKLPLDEGLCDIVMDPHAGTVRLAPAGTIEDSEDEIAARVQRFEDLSIIRALPDPFTQRDLQNYRGCEWATAKKQMTRWESDGLIMKSGKKGNAQAWCEHD